VHGAVRAEAASSLHPFQQRGGAPPEIPPRPRYTGVPAHDGPRSMGGSARAQTGEDMPNPEHETRTVVFTFADIIIARFRAGAEVMLADARDNVALCLRMNAGRRRPLLVDLRVVRRASQGVGGSQPQLLGEELADHPGDVKEPPAGRPLHRRTRLEWRPCLPAPGGAPRPRKACLPSASRSESRRLSPGIRDRNRSASRD